MKSKAGNGIISRMMDAFFITPEEAGLRLDKLLPLRFPHHSRTYFHYLIERGCVLVNGKQLKKREKVKAGDEIDVCFLLTEEISLEPEAIPLDILYEDDAVIAINKPMGMVVHPAPGHPRGTFVNALLHHCKALKGTDPLRPGIVHRLDKDTTGVLIAAKTATAHSRLVTAFSERAIKKTYIAICTGTPKEGLIDAPIARHPVLRQQMAVCPLKGKEARTHLRILSKSSDLACVELELITGRTHQIRVHLQHLGNPVLGDPVYGSPSANKKFQASRQLLHAASIKLLHPIYGTPLVIQAPLPSDISCLLTQLKTNV
jgi:23S rRNA pseudouridine1911/1915/1917 synthase